MLWLMLHLTVIYISVGFGLFLFNQYELRTHPDEIEEEKQELLIIYGIMVAAFRAYYHTLRSGGFSTAIR